MITRVCLGKCGRRIPANARDGRCDACRAEYRQGGHWSGDRDRVAQARFRRLLMVRAGGRCEWVDGFGRCSETKALQAHHVVPGNDNPNLGRLLCRQHHRMIDAMAR